MQTKEVQYAIHFEDPPVVLGPMSGSTYLRDPRHLVFTSARYNFVAKMFSGMQRVAEIGCGDGFYSPIVAQKVGRLDLYDFDPVFASSKVTEHDITTDPISVSEWHDAIYMLDVLEHINPIDEHLALENLRFSLKPNGGKCIIGMPSLESQTYASAVSKAGHVNCQNGEDLAEKMRHYFKHVFLFGMNDNVLHTGYAPMCHYILVLCAERR